MMIGKQGVDKVREVVGVFGGFLVGGKVLGVGQGTYFGEMASYIDMDDILGGIYKSLTFENTFLVDFYSMIMNMTYQYATDDTKKKMMGDDAVNFDLEMDYTFTPVSSNVELDASKDRKLQRYDQMLARIAEAGLLIVGDPERADVVIVNTCGFIAPAQRESLAAVRYDTGKAANRLEKALGTPAHIYYKNATMTALSKADL
jgi:hypothetical protein